MNMRIDIIRKELERRFTEVERIPDKTSAHVQTAINGFLHSLIMEPALRSFIIDLSRSSEKFMTTQKYNQIRNDFINSLKVIIPIVNNPDFIDEPFRNELNKDMNFSSFTFIQNIAANNNDLCEQFLNKLANFEDRFASAVAEDGLGRILGTISTIHGRGKEHGKFCDEDIYHKEYESLSELVNKIRANMQLRARYEGAESLNIILPIYLKSSYRYLSELSEGDFGEYFNQAVSRPIKAEISGPQTIDHCREVYHAVDKFLSTSKSKHALIARLITYCEWIKRDAFPQSKSKAKWGNEKKVSKIVEEFMFNHGYFPLVDFKIGKSIPDILSVSSANVGWDNSILMELKQSIGTSYTDGKLAENITQAKQYLSTVSGIKQGTVESVYLLVFYDEDYRLEIDKSYRDECEKDNVRIELIYVGEKSPSKLTKSKILKAPNSAARKKLPKKKAAKKATRRK